MSELKRGRGECKQEETEKCEKRSLLIGAVQSLPLAAGLFRQHDDVTQKQQ